jgi:hypothetical protein
MTYGKAEPYRTSGGGAAERRQTMKKLLASILVALLSNLICVAAGPANPNAAKEAQFTAKVKAAVLNLRTGPAAHVSVKLRDGTKLKGYITEAGDDRFVVVDNVDKKSGASTDVPYPQVRQVKGNNLSTGAKIAVAAAVFIGLAIAVAYAVRGK